MSLNQLFQLIQALPPNLQEEVALFVGYLKSRPQLKEKKESFSVNLDLPNYDQPLDIGQYTVQESDLIPIESLWSDEPDAETLCSMLTN